MSRIDDPKDGFGLTHYRHHGHHSTFLKTVFSIIIKVATVATFFIKSETTPR